MSLIEEVKKIAGKIENNKSVVTTEEGTKKAFIEPLLSALGYDVSNPREVKLEADCDITKQKGDKVDYLIHIEGKPAIIMECKHWQQDLSQQHENQLRRYYPASHVHVAILTNGIEYRFFTDIERANVMDEEAFLTIRMDKIDDKSISELERFSKQSLNETEITDWAKNMTLCRKIQSILEKDIENPSDDLVSYFFCALNEGKPTPEQVEQYRPIVKRCLAGITPQSMPKDSENIVTQVPSSENGNKPPIPPHIHFPNFTFSMVGIKPGETVTFIPTKIEVKVINNREVRYKGQNYRLSTFTKKFMPDNMRTKSNEYRGPRYFSYKGTKLTDLREQMENKLFRHRHGIL